MPSVDKVIVGKFKCIYLPLEGEVVVHSKKKSYQKKRKKKDTNYRTLKISLKMSNYIVMLMNLVVTSGFWRLRDRPTGSL